jgi:5-methylcytosine-specific restriction endonuclease McrA
MDININDSRAFKTWNFHLVDDPLNMILEAMTILLGNYDINRKWAANMILKVFLRDNFKRFLFEDKNLYPIDRNDYRVITWKKNILSRGKCEICGSTDNLEAHHILRWAEYPMGRFDVNNGECLCHKCHTEEHYGEKAYYMMKAKCG